MVVALLAGLQNSSIDPERQRAVVQGFEQLGKQWADQSRSDAMKFLSTYVYGEPSSLLLPDLIEGKASYEACAYMVKADTPDEEAYLDQIAIALDLSEPERRDLEVGCQVYLAGYKQAQGDDGATAQ